MLFQEFKIGVRSLLRQPGHALISVVAIGLGIGLCATMFSTIYAVYLRGIGVPESGRLVVVNQTNLSQNVSRMSVSQHDFYDWREQQTSFEGLAGYTTGSINLSDTGDPERIEGAFVSANAFDILRVSPVLGSTFREGDDRPGAPLTVLLAYDVWATRYASDPEVIGAAVRVNGEQATIIGVMPEGFLFPTEQHAWVPQRDVRAHNRRGEGPQFRVFGRLRDAVDRDEASLEMSLIAERLAEAYPETNEGIGVVFNSFAEMNVNRALPLLLTAQVATIFVLLIACANVTNLLLARATLRIREAAIRTAVGAGRIRVSLPFFAEAAILSLAGAALGVGITYVSVGVIDRATSNVGRPYFMEPSVDLPILGFVIAVMFLTALFTGAAPALKMGRANVSSVLKDERHGTSGFRVSKFSKILVVGEIAMSCALLVGAGLMTKSITNVRIHQFNFATDNIFTARVGIFDRDNPNRESRQGFFRDVQERLREVPGVSAVALTSRLPAAEGTRISSFAVEGDAYATDRDYPRAHIAVATPGLFHTFGTEVLQGRDFTVRDDADTPPVALVNQRFAERFFAGENPIGRRIRMGRTDSQDVWRTIIGVAPDLNMDAFLSMEDPAGFYLPLAQTDRRFLSLAVQVAGGNPMSITQDVRAAVRSVQSDTPIYWVRGMPEIIRQGTWVFDVFGGLFICFGLAALFLAFVGLYGILAFSVSGRIQEMGIRMALGADGRNVTRMVLRDGTKQIAVGLVFGLALAFANSAALASYVFQVQPHDPTVFLTVVAFILLVGLAACYMPARRATRVDPMEALRYE